jgi:hypothetical protein
MRERAMGFGVMGMGFEVGKEGGDLWYL